MLIQCRILINKLFKRPKIYEISVNDSLIIYLSASSVRDAEKKFLSSYSNVSIEAETISYVIKQKE